MNWIQRLFLGDLRHDWEMQCKTCSVLKEQLDYEREVNRELTETLTSMLRPVVLDNRNDNEALKPIKPKHQTWTRQRKELERQDKILADQMQRSQHLAKPDNLNGNDNKDIINKLEEELGINENAGTEKDENASE